MKIALTGSSGFLGNELLKILKNKKIDVKCYSLRSREKINSFLRDIKKNEFNVIINSAASLNPISHNDLYINKDLPREIQKSLKNITVTKFVHISSINVLHPLLSDTYTLSKKDAEISLDQNKVIIIRPSLIIDDDYNISNPLFEKLNLFKKGICPMIYPGNLYAPINIKLLSHYIVNVVLNDNFNQSALNIQGKENLYLWEIFNKYCKNRNRRAIKINTRFLNFILPKFIKKIFYKNNKFQNLLIIDRKIYKNIIEI